MTTTGRVRTWRGDEGWGVIDSPETPGGCWTHFSAVAVEGYRALTPGQAVVLEWEPAEQDGYAFRSVRAWPAGRQPVVDEELDPAPQAYGSTLTITFDPPAPAVFPGAPGTPAGSPVVDWITGATRRGRTVTAAVPPVYARYATVVIADDGAAKALTDAALVEVLRAYTVAQPWWLGYLDTGVADVVVPDAPRVAVHGWPYVLLEGGPEQALTLRRDVDATPWHSALPELVFPRDRSWLVSTLWDDDRRCVGGPAALIESLLLRPELTARGVAPDEDLGPCGPPA